MTQPAPESGALFGDLGFWITDGPTALTSPAPASGATGPSQGFSLRHGEAMDLLKRTETALDELGVAMRTAQAIEQMRPPADDPASMDYHRLIAGPGGRATGALGAGVGHMHREFDYLSELATRLREALGLTQRTDAGNAAAVSGAGQSGRIF
jgi:hypothetical protein